MSNTLLTPEVRARIERRFEFTQEDGNLMRAGFNQSNYAQDVVVLMAEISQLDAELTEVQGFKFTPARA
jgi:hypothetical protein